MRTVSTVKVGGIGYSKRNREKVLLVGDYNGVNREYSLPEAAIHDPPRKVVMLFHNGRMMMDYEYTVYESIPGSSGYDRVRTLFAPQSVSRIMANYIVA